MSIFDSVDVEPSAFEIALQSIFLSGLQQRVAETGDLRSSVDAALGFKRDADGQLVALTESERFDSLNPNQQNLYNRLQDQNTRLEKAFAGELPVSERLRQRSEDQLRFAKEGRGRKGSAITGDTLASAQGFDTPTIQHLGQARRTQGLLEDTEARNEIDRGFDNLFKGTGLLQSSRERDMVNRINAPARFDIGGFGGGLLTNTGRNSRMNAAFSDQNRSALGGVLTSIADLFI